MFYCSLIYFSHTVTFSSESLILFLLPPPSFSFLVPVVELKNTFPVLAGVCSGPPPTVQRHDDSNLAVGVNSFVSLC